MEVSVEVHFKHFTVWIVSDILLLDEATSALDTVSRN